VNDKLRNNEAHEQVRRITRRWVMSFLSHFRLSRKSALRPNSRPPLLSHAASNANPDGDDNIKSDADVSPSANAANRAGSPATPAAPLALTRLSIVIPARNEEGCIEATVSHLNLELRLNGVPHEILVVDDGSTDQTWEILTRVAASIPELRPVRNSGPHGFGRAIIKGLDSMAGDAVVVMMADESDDPRDVVRYWKILNEGYDCVFGSRFVRGGGVIDYPWLKLRVNRLANVFIRMLFRIPLNDTTNAFKAYRKTVIDGCRPMLSPHFNLTVELPLKAIVRGFSWTTMPITWRNRRTGEAKLKIKEMGSRYFFIVAYVWLERHFSRGDYLRPAFEESRSDSRSVRHDSSERPSSHLYPSMDSGSATSAERLLSSRAATGL
jgi:dolichol-phosphate mannosyltransferase